MVSFTFDNVLAPGRYAPVFQLTHRGSGLDVIDRFEGSFSFVVTGPSALGGLIDLPVQSDDQPRCRGHAEHADMSVQAPPPSAPSEPDVVPYEALGRPITGPRAITGDWRRFWHLTFNIALTQWKLRFFGSALGYLWQLVRPLLLFLVLYVFFTEVAQVGASEGPDYHYLRRAAAGLDRPLHVLRRGDHERGARRRGQRAARAQDPVSRVSSSRCRSFCSRCSTCP